MVHISSCRGSEEWSGLGDWWTLNEENVEGGLMDTRQGGDGLGRLGGDGEKVIQAGFGGIGGRAEEGGLGGQCGREELVGGGGLVGPPPWSSR